jgi:hypothetical protein
MIRFTFVVEDIGLLSDIVAEINKLQLGKE